MALAVNGINMTAEAARQTMTAVRMLNPLRTTTMVLLGAKNPWCSPLVMLVTSSSCCDVSIARDFYPCLDWVCLAWICSKAPISACNT